MQLAWVTIVQAPGVVGQQAPTQKLIGVQVAAEVQRKPEHCAEVRMLQVPSLAQHAPMQGLGVQEEALPEVHVPVQLAWNATLQAATTQQAPSAGQAVAPQIELSP